jgi:hypothetical protein
VRGSFKWSKTKNTIYTYTVHNKGVLTLLY